MGIVNVSAYSVDNNQNSSKVFPPKCRDSFFCHLKLWIIQPLSALKVPKKLLPSPLPIHPKTLVSAYLRVEDTFIGFFRGRNMGVAVEKKSQRWLISTLWTPGDLGRPVQSMVTAIFNSGHTWWFSTYLY